MWDELGIAPCDDPKAIRRAYAARLKKLDPDREPGAFARLRAAYERALSASGRNGGGRGSAAQTDPPSGDDDADPIADADAPALAGRESAAQSAPSTDQIAEPRASPPGPDHDDIRDRALLIALDAALRHRDAATAIAFYYRAAATGALPLASTSDLIERLITVAVDDTTLDAAAFRDLIRIVGLGASRAQAPVSSELRKHVLARLAAEDWYDDLLAKAQRKKGAIARLQRKLARLVLGRIGRHWHPRVDKAALQTWLTQYHAHAAWLGERIDPAWIKTLEGRLRRRQIFWVAVYILFIGGCLLQFVLLTVFGVSDGDAELWPLIMGPFLVAFLLWIFFLLVKELLKLLFPGWRGIAGIVGPRDLIRRGRALWDRLIAKARGTG
ncbi:MAG TPA: J domain-containing protein [Xanthobacteraceae bacterium]